jgi:hypothetical protein
VRRNWIVRSLASAFSVWLAVSMVEPVQLHACAMHGGLAIEQAGMHGAHGHSAAGHSHGQHNDGKSHQCSCLGDCNGGSGSIGLTATAVSLFAAVVNDGSSARFDYISPALVAPQFLLPFGNGPPSSSRA